MTEKLVFRQLRKLLNVLLNIHSFNEITHYSRYSSTRTDI